MDQSVQTEADRKRDRILTAAARALVTEGPQCSMALIAKRAQVATGSIYTYFASKDELIVAVHRRLAQQMQDALLPATPRGAARDRFEDYLSSYISFFWGDPDRATLFEILSSAPLVPASELITSYARSSRYIQRVLIDLSAETGATLHDPATTAAFIGGAIRNALKWYRTRGDGFTSEEIEQLKQLCRQTVSVRESGD